MHLTNYENMIKTELIMKKKLFFIFLALGLEISLLSCKNDNNEIIDDEDEKEYTLPAPELVISTPVPCINEDVGFSFKSDLNVEPVWDFGDKTTSSEKTAEHSYSEEGTFTVNLKLSDGQGGTVSVDTTITVMGKRLNDALEDLINDPSKIWVCSHRGNTYYGQKIGDIPENSIEAIQRAAKAGAEMIEIDVRTSSDNALVIMHDATVDRTTNGAGTVSEMTLAVLKRLRLKAEDCVVTTSVIPTLEEALLAGRGKIFYELDIKSGVDIPAVVHLVDSLHMLDRVVFYRGKDKDKAIEVTAINSQCIIFPYVQDISLIEYWATDPRIKLIQVGYDDLLTDEVVSAARSKGMVSFTSYISDAILNNDFTVVDKIRGLQIQIILTNYVEYMKPYLESGD